jgi:hypothetical protein
VVVVGGIWVTLEVELVDCISVLFDVGVAEGLRHQGDVEGGTWRRERK